MQPESEKEPDEDVQRILDALSRVPPNLAPARRALLLIEQALELTNSAIQRASDMNSQEGVRLLLNHVGVLEGVRDTLKVLLYGWD
jgi:hypothetical protein